MDQAHGSQERKKPRARIRIVPLVILFFCGLIAAFVVLARSDSNVEMVVAEKLLKWERRRGSEPTFIKALFGIELRADEKSLFDSIAKGDVRSTSVLLDSQISPNSIGSDGRSALRSAVELGSRDIFMLLVARNADVNLRDTAGLTPLLGAVKKNNVDLVQQLISVGADVNGMSADGATPLFVAVQEQNLPMMEIILGQHANVNLTGEGNPTPLMEAIDRDNPTVVNRLIQNGANVNIRDGEGDNALMYAVRSENVQIIASLLSTPINLDAKNNSGQTAVQYALTRGGKIAELFSKALAPDAAVNVIQRVEARNQEVVQPVVEATPSEADEVFGRRSTGTFSTARSSANDRAPIDRPTPVPMTRLRLVGKLEGVWGTKKVLTLQTVQATVRNAGDYDAEEIAIKLRVPGGKSLSMTGPKKLERNAVGIYKFQGSEKVSEIGGLKEELNCSNCYR